ncbi:hypothetical protein [Rhizobium sp. Leaf383]|uniref:hypothetical protein n=1 Tax=Rhizobium sp. Leaf383 TaxID=1736357 RepID=UPI0007148D7D|nr:hypothetical protein [Rhizobium sp. Leaf383]KQS84800.1 hypothetical protein ASG58_20085 [Rhizobium sp. Leaf383]
MSGQTAFWFKLVVPEGIDLSRPGIYQWTIEGVGTYIGQSRNLRSRLREYDNNVRKLAAGLPYRKSKPYAFRAVHRELHAAKSSGAEITVTILENCGLKELNARERFWIAARATLNGPHTAR